MSSNTTIPHLTPSQIQALIDFKHMLDCPQSDQKMGFYASVLIEMFVALWLITWICELILSRYWTTFIKANVLTRRNILTYFQEIVITTVLLVWCLVLLNPILFNPDYTHDNVNQILFIGLVVMTLYIFELIYRLEMRWQLILHHLVTILLILLSIYKFEHDSYLDPNGQPVLKAFNLKGAILMALTALTEQPIFLGLLLYRVGYKFPKLFYFSAVQNVIIKLVYAFAELQQTHMPAGNIHPLLHGGIIALYFIDKIYEDDFWKWFLWIAIEIVLLPVQMYACFIQFSIGRRLVNKANHPNKAPEQESQKHTQSPTPQPISTGAPSSPNAEAKPQPRQPRSKSTATKTDTQKLGTKPTRKPRTNRRVAKPKAVAPNPPGQPVEEAWSSPSETDSSEEHSDDDFIVPNQEERRSNPFLLPMPRSQLHVPEHQKTAEEEELEEIESGEIDFTMPSRDERDHSMFYAKHSERHLHVHRHPVQETESNYDEDEESDDEDDDEVIDIPPRNNAGGIEPAVNSSSSSSDQ